MVNKYRFSPIMTKEGLLEAITYTHFSCHRLCLEYYGKLLPVSGNVGIFSHYDDEFALLTKLKEELVVASENWNNKYYRLKQPIVIPAKDNIPETTYTFLYIRHPDPLVTQVGDIDFFLSGNEYAKLKQSLTDKKAPKGLKLANHPSVDMVQLSTEDCDVWGFILNHKMSDEFNI